MGDVRKEGSGERGRDVFYETTRFQTGHERKEKAQRGVSDDTHEFHRTP